jgi:hypothetical protein
MYDCGKTKGAATDRPAHPTHHARAQKQVPPENVQGRQCINVHQSVSAWFFMKKAALPVWKKSSLSITCSQIALIFGMHIELMIYNYSLPELQEVQAFVLQI